MNDLNNLLSGCNTPDYLFTNGACRNVLNEILDYLIIYVSLKKRQPYFMQAILDIGLGKAPFSAQLAEDVFEIIGNRFKHTVC